MKLLPEKRISSSHLRLDAGKIILTVPKEKIIDFVVITLLKKDYYQLN